MVCATVVQSSSRAAWLLQLLLAVCLFTQWCESQCDPPVGAPEELVDVDWSLTSAQDGSLPNQLNAESTDVLFFCCPTVSSNIIVVTQADFDTCNTNASSIVSDTYSCNNNHVIIRLTPLLPNQPSFAVNETHYFISNSKSECDSGLKLPVSVFEVGQLPPSTAPPVTTAPTTTNGGGGGGSGGSTITPSGSTSTEPLRPTDLMVLGVPVVVFASSATAAAVLLVLIVSGTIFCLVVIVKIKHRRGSVNDSVTMMTHIKTSNVENGNYKHNGSSEFVDSGGGNSKVESSFSSDEVTMPAAQQNQQALSPLKSPSRPAPPKPPALSSLPASSSRPPPPPNKPALSSLPAQYNRGPASPARKPPPPPVNRYNGRSNALLPPK